MTLRLCAWVVLSALVVGCGNPTEHEILVTARNHLAAGDRQAAVIALKNVLQANQQSAEARLLLGTTMLEMGDPVSAAVELAKARELKLPESSVVPLLARALLAQGRPMKVIEDFSTVPLPDTVAQESLLGVLAAAHLAAGQLDKAAAQLDAAAKIAPPSPETQFVRARLLAGRDDLPRALKLLDAVIAAKPKDAQPLSVRGELLYRDKQVDAAVASFRQALAVDPAIAAAHTALISIALEKRDEKAARLQFGAMKKVRPNHPETQYFLAQFAYLDGELKAAREALLKLQRRTPNNPRVLQLSGMVDLKLNDLQQAESSFNKVLQLAPELTSVRRLLALTNLRMGKEDKALQLLAPLLDSPVADVEALSMAANVHLGRGDAARAEALYLRAAKTSPDVPSVRIALALSQLAKGDSAGFDSLKSVAQTDPEPSADLALVSAYLSRGELTAAQSAVDKLRTKLIDSPLPDQLTGRIEVLSGRGPQARVAFERALKADPAYFPAVASLVVLDLGDGNATVARTRLEAFVSANPADTRSRVALIELAARTGTSRPEIIKAMQEVVAQLPNEQVLRVQLAEQHMAALDFKSALQVANDAAVSSPSDPATLETLGQAQAANGQTQQAILTFKRLALQQPHSASSHLRLAAVYQTLGSTDQMIESLKQAQAAASGDVRIGRQIVDMLMRSRLPKAAIEAAQLLQKQLPSAAGHLLEGDIELQRNNLPAALAAYRAGLAKSRPGDKAAASLHRALLRAKQIAQADAFMASRLNQKPPDIDFLLYVADLTLVRGDKDAALTRYLEVISLQPENTAALNNAAWLRAQRGQVDAVMLAQRAVALQPENPSFLDTLALALNASRQFDRGIQVAKHALALAPESASIRLTLARLYVDSGQKKNARAELEQLAKLGSKFDGQPVVARLLKSLDA